MPAEVFPRPSPELPQRNLADDYSNVTPSAIRANWSALSLLPEKIFSQIYSDASALESSNHAQTRILSADSLKGFLELWRAVRAIAASPVTSITPKGYICAEWYENEENNLTVMFNNDGQALYSLFEEGNPCEGIEHKTGYKDLISMLYVRQTNPFLRSDLQE